MTVFSEAPRRKKHIIIVGTRGIPARHGGFETFAEKLALYLCDRGWQVTVACQVPGSGPRRVKVWQGVNRVLIQVGSSGARATVAFDWKSTWFALRSGGVVLVLGYNTAVMSLLYRLRGVPNVMNMDGIEWKRKKWRFFQKWWLYLNERFAGLVATRLIADHPEIRRHLSRGLVGRSDIAVIPYGADPVPETTRNKSEALLGRLNLAPLQYALVIARPEPENQILEIVRAFARKRRGHKLVVLGEFDTETNTYHRAVVESASDEVVFVGAIYDSELVGALRANTAIYIHGHTVGGTNPSLVESLAAGAPVLAHGNAFNRWVAADAGRYFADENECAEQLDTLLYDGDELTRMRMASAKRFYEEFTWGNVLPRYERVLLDALQRKAGRLPVTDT